MIPTIQDKWNDIQGKRLFLLSGRYFYVVTEGEASEITMSDHKNGYYDYWLTEMWDLVTGTVISGGKWMEKELICNEDYTISDIINRLSRCDLPDAIWIPMEMDMGRNIHDYLQGKLTAEWLAKRESQKSRRCI